MKFSQRTIQILKNFATISQSMIFNPGTEIKVVSDLSTILAIAHIDTVIPDAFAIYDMPRFLSAISMFEDPELDIQNGHMVMSEGQEQILYNFAEPTLIKQPPKSIREIESNISFTLKNDVITRVFKGAAITGASNICISGDGEKTFIEALTSSDGSRHNVNTGASYKMEIGETTEKFNYIFLVENIKLLPGDYEVKIPEFGIAHFKGADIEYYIAVESTSTFGK